MRNVVLAVIAIGTLAGCRPESPSSKAQASERKAAQPPSPPVAGASVAYAKGLPRFVIDGVAQYPFLDITGCSSSGGCGVTKGVDDAVRNGTRVVGPRILHMGIENSNFDDGKGNFHWELLDHKATNSLAIVKDAQLCVNIRFRYDNWALRNPDEAVKYGGAAPDPKSNDEWAGPVPRPSAASEKFRELVCRAIDSMGEHVRQASWGDRVVAVRICYGGATEWFTYSPRAYPDMGVAMTRAFRRYLKAKYSSDAALRAAWNDPDVTLATAAVPTARQRCPGGFLIDPATNRRTSDYYRCSAEAMADLLLAMAARTKKALPGRLVGAYYGYVFNAWPSEASNFLLDRVLASPDIDFLSNPPTYSDEVRPAGHAFNTKAIPATFWRHGKIHVLEDDSRFHFMSNWAVKAYCSRSPEEDRARVRRNVLNTLFDRGGYQICDPIAGRSTRRGSFDDPVLLRDQRRAFDVLHSVVSLPEDSGNDTAVVVNYRDKFYAECEYDNRNRWMWAALWEYAPTRMTESGCAYDMLTIDDLLASKKRYSKILFLSAFYLMPAERAALKPIVRRPGTSVAWLVAPGAVTEEKLSDAAMSELTGMTLTGACPLPDVRCVDAQARAIAAADGGWEKTLPGGARAFFFPKMPTSPAAYRGIFTALGAFAYTPLGVCLRRHGDCLMVHVGKAGTYPVALPSADRHGLFVEAFSGQVYAADAITLTSDGPATWFLRRKP